MSSPSLALEVNNPVIDNLVESSLESEYKRQRLEWISYEEVTNIEPTPIDNVYNSSWKCKNGFLPFCEHQDGYIIVLIDLWTTI